MLYLLAIGAADRSVRGVLVEAAVHGCGRRVASDPTRLVASLLCISK